MNKIPRQAIRWYIGTLHVGNSDETIAQDIRTRLETYNFSVTEKQIAACIDYALKCHHDNQKLYNDVMTGRL